jgi:D-alanine-D-alanine ligase-like ATP-grasp enzyme
MLKVSTSLPDIVVLRGGNRDFKQSLTEGGEVLASLTKIGYEPVDVLIGKDGEWTARGFPTNPHDIFSKAHTVVDTTRMKGQEYQSLARRMGVPLLFSEDHDVTLNREDLYRVLRQQDIKVPETFVVRAHDPLDDKVFRHLWTHFHTPLLIRPLIKNQAVQSKLIKRFHDLEEVLHKYHEEGIDVHVLTYKKLPTSSVATLPHFRNEEIYTSMWVDSFQDGDELPSKNSHLRPHFQPPEFKKEHVTQLAKKIHKALGLKHPACIDFVYHNNHYITVNVDYNPSLRKDGRFAQSLATTGVETGHYIHEHIKREFGR